MHAWFLGQAMEPTLTPCNDMKNLPARRCTPTFFCCLQAKERRQPTTHGQDELFLSLTQTFFSLLPIQEMTILRITIVEISFETHLQNLVHDRTPCASGNLCYITNDQKHLILPDGKLFVIGMDPNEKAMIKCDVVCTASTHAGLRAWCRDFQQFCHDHARSSNASDSGSDDDSVPPLHQDDDSSDDSSASSDSEDEFSMASAAEAELGALFINAKEGTMLRTTLEEMGHPQLDPTPIQTDNSTAYKIANGTCKQQRSKAMDMRFYWIRDRITQKQFRAYWKPGTDNYADYFTKHHAPTHHTRVRPKYLYVKGQSGNNRNYINKH